MSMAPVVPRASARAAGSGPTYPSSVAVSRIRRRSLSESWSGRENAFDTVILLTPTRSAIVCRVTRGTPPSVVGGPVQERPSTVPPLTSDSGVGRPAGAQADEAHESAEGQE